MTFAAEEEEEEEGVVEEKGKKSNFCIGVRRTHVKRLINRFL